MMKKLLFPALLLLTIFQVTAQSPQDVTIALSATVSAAEPRITLNWPLSDTASVQIKRRLKGQSGGFWTQLLNESSTTQTSFVDENVILGNTYEYHIRTITNGLTAQGYAHVAVVAPLVEYRGKILVFIDSTTADAVGLELKVFKDAMRGDGWQPVPNKIGPSATVETVKNKIKELYNADPTNVKAILLIGDVPVPYSGNFAWDGHPDHAGAWPSDAYYADVNGNWTDATVDNSVASRDVNKNVPGDGKFDQSYLPSPVELMIGRIDFRHLQTATFGASPIELTKRYLLKSARWRTKQYTVPYRGLVDDNFGYFGGEAFASNGYRNAYPVVGANNVSPGDFLNDTGGEGYLFGYATGPGSYTSAGGVGTSEDIAADSINVVFSNIFGSYHGDWDYENNPLMPSVIASKGAVLNCAWAGRPHWFMQALASGEPIGYCAKETMNAANNTEYYNSTGRGGAHVALLGDPTTRAIIVAQVPTLTFVTHCNSIDLNWTASPDTGILGYHIYRSKTLDGPYTRLTSSLVTDLTWTDNSPWDSTFYQVRAVRIDQTPGGGIFYNASSGLIRFVVLQAGTAPVVTISGVGTLSCLNNAITLVAAASMPLSGPITWILPNGSTISGSAITVSQPGLYIAAGTSPAGCTGTASFLVTSNNTPPSVTFPSATINCINPIAAYQLPTTPTFLYTYNGTNYQAGNDIIFPGGGLYTVTVTNPVNGCTAVNTIQINEDLVSPNLAINASDTLLTCATPTLTLTAVSNTPPVTFFWNTVTELGASVTVSTPDTYCVVATNISNGCTTQSCITIGQNTTTPIPNFQVTNETAPNTFNGAISLVFDPPLSNVTYQWSNGAQTPSIVGLTAGIYTVLITFEDGCQKVYTVQVTTTTGTTTPDAGLSVNIAPNPAATFTQITVNTPAPTAMRMNLLDVNGKLITSQSVGITNNHTFMVDTHQLPDGFYTVHLSLEEKSVVRKLVVCNSEK